MGNNSDSSTASGSWPTGEQLEKGTLQFIIIGILKLHLCLSGSIAECHMTAIFILLVTHLICRYTSFLVLFSCVISSVCTSIQFQWQFSPICISLLKYPPLHFPPPSFCDVHPYNYGILFVLHCKYIMSTDDNMHLPDNMTTMYIDLVKWPKIAFFQFCDACFQLQCVHCVMSHVWKCNSCYLRAWHSIHDRESTVYGKVVKYMVYKVLSGSS